LQFFSLPTLFLPFFLLCRLCAITVARKWKWNKTLSVNILKSNAGSIKEVFMKFLCKTLAVFLLISALAGCNANKTDSSNPDNTSKSSSATSSVDSSSEVSSDDLNDLWPDVELEVESNPDASQGASTDSNDPVEEADPNAPTVYLETEQSGNTVTVKFMVKNNPGVAAYTVNVTFDKQKVTPKTITAGISSPVVSNLQQPNVTLSGSAVSAVYANTKGFSNDGEMFNITFEIKEGASGEAKFEIVADEQDFVAPDYAIILFKKQGAKISIS
jgi:hypothetical protein